MSRNPFNPSCDQETEFSFGRGRFPPRNVDFQSPRIGNGVAQIADPDKNQQLLDLAAMKRTNLQDPTVPEMPAFSGAQGEHPDYYTEGNTDRYGANPPLIRSRRWPKFVKYRYWRPSFMERQW
jgi:hypothetical protein